MRRTMIFASAAVALMLCSAAHGQGGVTIRPDGPCGPSLPGEQIVMFNTMNHGTTVFVTQNANGVVSELKLQMRQNSQLALGCSVHGVAQWTWTLKSVKQPEAPLNPPPPVVRRPPPV